MYHIKSLTLRQQKEAIKKVVRGTTFRVALLCLCFVIGFLYIWQTNTVSTKGYVLTDLEQRIAELEYENRKLSVEIAEQSSLYSIQERLEHVSLVSVDHVDYVDMRGTAVAQR